MGNQKEISLPLRSSPSPAAVTLPKAIPWFGLALLEPVVLLISLPTNHELHQHAETECLVFTGYNEFMYLVFSS